MRSGRYALESYANVDLWVKDTQIWYRSYTCEIEILELIKRYSEYLSK